MRILIVATKSPWPPRDGGRLALWWTMHGLASAGHELVLLAPVDRAVDATSAETLDALRPICTPHLIVAERRSWWSAAIRASRSGRALTIARHQLDAVSAGVKRCIDHARPDVVHVEQLQALAHCDAAFASGIPVVLRMQNVESTLWFQVAAARLRSWPLWFEARRLQRDETRALRRVARTITLTQRDADALRARVDHQVAERIIAISPPFPSRLPAAPPIKGVPAIVVVGSAGWWPNQEGVRWFFDAVMPQLRSIKVQMQIHAYGGNHVTDVDVTVHPAPADAIEAFPQDAIAAIPLHIGSGIRMRILEAWSRGLPVVATTVAAAGLDVQSGRELLIADTPQAFAEAIQRLASNPDLRAALADAGRSYLRIHHEGSALAAAVADQYRIAIAQQSVDDAK